MAGNKLSITQDVGVSYLRPLARNVIYSGTATPSSGGGQTINNEDIYVTSNGTYTASEGYTGLGEVTVALPLDTKSITENGTYYAVDDGLQGFSEVTVDVSQGDIVTATNTTGSAIAEGDKVWLEKKTSAGTRDFSTYRTQFFTIDDTTQIIDFCKTGSSSDWGSIYKMFLTSFAVPTTKLVFQTKVKAGAVPEGGGDYSTGKGIEFCGNSSQSSYNASSPLIHVWCDNKLACTGPEGVSKTKTIVGTSSFDKNQWYWVKYIITDTSYTIYWSTDGINWTTFGTYTGSGFFAAMAAKYGFSIRTMGYFSYNGTHQYVGIVDLGETFLQADDSVYWWRPYLNSVIGWNIMPYKYLSINSFSGFANEAIAVNGTGEVKTILPEQVTVTVTASADNAEITAF